MIAPLAGHSNVVSRSDFLSTVHRSRRWSPPGLWSKAASPGPAPADARASNWAAHPVGLLTYKSPQRGAAQEGPEGGWRLDYTQPRTAGAHRHWPTVRGGDAVAAPLRGSDQRQSLAPVTARPGGRQGLGDGRRVPAVGPDAGRGWPAGVGRHWPPGGSHQRRCGHGRDCAAASTRTVQPSFKLEPWQLAAIPDSRCTLGHCSIKYLWPKALSVEVRPKGRQSLAALRRSIHEEFFIQVNEAAIQTRDGP